MHREFNTEESPDPYLFRKEVTYVEQEKEKSDYVSGGYSEELGYCICGCEDCGFWAAAGYPEVGVAHGHDMGRNARK